MALLRNRWVLGAVAAGALALLVWFLGDLLALGGWRPLDTGTQRLGGVVLVLLGWLAFEGVRLLRARRANQRLIDGMAGEGDSSAEARAAHEVETLRARFGEAVATLRKAKLHDAAGERRELSELPWYVIIGAPGSGKTTALVNAGLRFPLEEDGAGQAVKGVGGTRNCDWWFTDEAVLLDTAGRYTTQDSESDVDTAAWRGFLDLLKQSRPRRPLNGALITVSVSDLLSQDAAARERYALHVRARVAELYERLGVRFPVYLMVTKSDLLAGFMEYFGDLDREAREQVWGMTFALADDAASAPGDAFAAEFSLLEERLHALLLGRLREERDPQRRALAYSFPQQLGALGPLLGTFVEQAFGASGGAPALLRGVYFTSGTQEGSPIDRVLGTLARTFQLEQKILPPAASSGKSYFLNHVLRRVVFPEAGLAGFDARYEARRARLLAAAWGACGLVTVSLFAAWTMSYLSNRAWVAQAATQVAAAKSAFDALPGAPEGEPTAVIKVLDALHDLPHGYGARNTPVPLTQGFGLHPDELADRARHAYRRAAAELLLPRVALALERAIATAEPRERARLAADYAMLFDDAKIDPRAVAVAAVTVLSGADALALQRHLAAALEVRPVVRGVPFNAALLEAGRSDSVAAPRRAK